MQDDMDGRLPIMTEQLFYQPLQMMQMNDQAMNASRTTFLQNVDAQIESALSTIERYNALQSSRCGHPDQVFLKPDKVQDAPFLKQGSEQDIVPVKIRSMTGDCPGKNHINFRKFRQAKLSRSNIMPLFRYSNTAVARTLGVSLSTLKNFFKMHPDIHQELLERRKPTVHN